MKVFIDGRSGTTGLRIETRLRERADVELVTLPEEERHDDKRRKWALNHSDVAFLCLPDTAAREAVAMIENDRTVILDTSTAHRTAPGWAYGFPELSEEFRAAVKKSRRIAVPGCHASGFVSLVYPLIRAGVLPAGARLSCFSLTGYSGGGKSMIANYEAAERASELDAPRQYALSQSHKHLPEMQVVTGLSEAPIFCPIVADYHSGMEVTVPVFRSQLAPGADAEAVRAVLKAAYPVGLVRYVEAGDEAGFLAANRLSGTDTMEISVFGNEERILLCARFDNLGKGASGAAMQCMNLVTGTAETAGLVE